MAGVLVGSGSMDGDRSAANEIAPPFKVLSMCGRELLRRGADDPVAAVGEVIVHPLGAHRLDRELIDALDRVGWRAGGRKQSVPDRYFERITELHERRHLVREADARRPGGGENSDLAGA